MFDQDNLTPEQEQEIIASFRAGLKKIDEVERYSVYLNPLMTEAADMAGILTGFATRFDVDNNGSEQPIIIVGEDVKASPYYEAILFHEMGHHVCGHFDGRSDSDRVESQELEADAYSFSRGTNILEWLESLVPVLEEQIDLVEAFYEGPHGKKVIEDLGIKAFHQAMEQARFPLEEIKTRIVALS